MTDQAAGDRVGRACMQQMMASAGQFFVPAGAFLYMKEEKE